MATQVKISLVETIAHEFTFDVPDDVDATDPHAIMEWAEDFGKVDYSDGEPTGNNELKILDGKK